MTFQGKRGVRVRRARRDKNLSLCFFFASIGLSFVGILYAATAGFLALWFLASWVADSDLFSQYTNRNLWELRISIIALGCAITAWPIYRQWRVERAEAKDGVLVPSDYDSDIPKDRFCLKIAGSPRGQGAFLVPNDKKSSPLGVMGDSVVLEPHDGTVALSTVVRDEASDLIVEIDGNVWHVSHEQHISWDKNYNKDSLEVLDGQGRVVLWVKALKNEIQIEGDWHREDHWEVKITEGPDGPVMLSEPMYYPDIQKVALARKFLYPGKDHWGELAKH